MTKEQVIELAKQAGFQKFLKPADRPEMICDPAALERFATLVRNAALEEAAALGRVGDRTKNPAIVEFVGEIYELKEPTP